MLKYVSAYVRADINISSLTSVSLFYLEFKNAEGHVREKRQSPLSL